MQTNAAKPREWPTKARRVGEDILAREATLREMIRGAQEAAIAGNDNATIVLLARATDLSWRTTQQLGAALMGKYEE